MEKKILDNFTFGKKFTLIAGPCVIESKDLLFKVAEGLCEITESLDIGLIFKGSYDKANRSSIESFRGPGGKHGIELLLEVKEKFSVPVTSDVHSASEAAEFGPELDIVQVPALLSRQTDLLVACGNTKRCVNVKKGQFMAPKDILNVLQKIESTGNKNIIITERGTSFGYNNLIADMRSPGIMAEYGYPVVFDATHVVQFPGGGGNKSSGDRRFIPALARAAVGAGVDGVFMEVHPDPDNALCDGPNMIKLDSLKELLIDLKRIDDVVKKRDN